MKKPTPFTTIPLAESASPGASSGASLGLAQVITDYLSAYFEAHGEMLPSKGLYDRILKEVEKPLLSETLKIVHGNQVKAAEILGLHRNTLRKKIQELGILVLQEKLK